VVNICTDFATLVGSWRGVPADQLRRDVLAATARRANSL
jgi:hypothetical protein